MTVMVASSILELKNIKHEYLRNLSNRKILPLADLIDINIYVPSRLVIFFISVYVKSISRPRLHTFEINRNGKDYGINR